VGDVRAPDGGPAGDRPAETRSGDGRAPLRPSVPRSFQNRLTIAFVGLVALTLTLVAPVVVNRLDDYLRQQEEQSLRIRAEATASILDRFIEDSVGEKSVVIETTADGTRRAVLNPVVSDLLVDGRRLTLLANNVAQADITLEFGPARRDTDGVLVTYPATGLRFEATLDADPAGGQARDPAIAPARAEWTATSGERDWGMIVTLSNPYTSRASTLGAIAGLLLVMASLAVLVAILLAAFLAHRFTTPVTRLTEASRRLAEGDLSSRVPSDEVASNTLELRALSQQFNTMADRLEESVRIIRRDRDLSREFLADVSHELRTPIAAMRTFVELLQGPAGTDASARTEFLDSSAVQLDRLDWLAQNLLELSKLDSGLVLLDLRPEDIRGTIESAVEQQLAAADRRGIHLTTTLPDRPLRVQHDPPRVGQIVTNLVGNAVKFTPRGGEVRVTAAPDSSGGVRIEVEDSGVGIDESELPRIFERFYRGSEANEARSTGSGLGLAIVKSIVDMHRGTIAVESRVGKGTRFVVILPRDPREGAGGPPAGSDRTTGSRRKVDDSSPTAVSPVNPDPAPLTTTPDRPGSVPPNPPERSSPSQ